MVNLCTLIVLTLVGRLTIVDGVLRGKRENESNNKSPQTRTHSFEIDGTTTSTVEQQQQQRLDKRLLSPEGLNIRHGISINVDTVRIGKQSTRWLKMEKKEKEDGGGSNQMGTNEIARYSASNPYKAEVVQNLYDSINSPAAYSYNTLPPPYNAPVPAPSTPIQAVPVSVPVSAPVPFLPPASFPTQYPFPAPQPGIFNSAETPTTASAPQPATFQKESIPTPVSNPLFTVISIPIKSLDISPTESLPEPVPMNPVSDAPVSNNTVVPSASALNNTVPSVSASNSTDPISSASNSTVPSTTASSNPSPSTSSPSNPIPSTTAPSDPVYTKANTVSGNTYGNLYNVLGSRTSDGTYTSLSLNDSQSTDPSKDPVNQATSPPSTVVPVNESTSVPTATALTNTPTIAPSTYPSVVPTVYIPLSPAGQFFNLPLIGENMTMPPVLAQAVSAEVPTIAPNSTLAELSPTMNIPEEVFEPLPQPSALYIPVRSKQSGFLPSVPRETDVDHTFTSDLEQNNITFVDTIEVASSTDSADGDEDDDEEAENTTNASETSYGKSSIKDITSSTLPESTSTSSTDSSTDPPLPMLIPVSTGVVLVSSTTSSARNSPEVQDKNEENSDSDVDDVPHPFFRPSSTKTCGPTAEWLLAGLDTGNGIQKIVPCQSHYDCLDYDDELVVKGSYTPCCMAWQCICGSTMYENSSSSQQCAQFECTYDVDCGESGKCLNGHCDFTQA